MDISEFSYLWSKETRGQWGLNQDGFSSGYSIIDLRDSDELRVLEIEDDIIYEAVIEKMLNEGVKILTSDEMSKLGRNDLPQNLSDAEKEELWKSAQRFLNTDKE